jgi:MFS family permease
MRQGRRFCPQLVPVVVPLVYKDGLVPSEAVAGTNVGGPLGLPRTFWFLWFGMLVNRMGGAVWPFLPVYLKRVHHFTPAAAGLMLSLYSGGALVAGPLGGLLADRWGRRPTLLAGTTLAAATMLGLGAARTPLLIGALAILLGFFTEGARPALQAAVADVVPAADRRRAFGVLYWAVNLGFSIAALAAGRLAQWSFSWLFVIDAATTLFYGAVVLLAVPETRPAAAPVTGPATHPLREVSAPLRDRRFVVFAAIQLLVILIFQQMFVPLQLDLDMRHVTTQMIGNVLAVNGVIIVAVQPLILRLTARVPAAHLLAVGAALVAMAVGLCAVPGGIGVIFAAMAVVTLGEIAFSIATPTLLTDMAPAAQRGGYMGAHQVVWTLAGLAGPVTGAFVLGFWGGQALWLGSLAIGLAAAVGHATLTRQVSREAVIDGGR